MNQIKKLLILLLIFTPFTSNAGGKDCNVVKCTDEEYKSFQEFEITKKEIKEIDENDEKIKNNLKYPTICTSTGCSNNSFYPIRGLYSSTDYFLGEIKQVDSENKIVYFKNYVSFSNIWKFDKDILPIEKLKISEEKLDFLIKNNPKYIIFYANLDMGQIDFLTLIDSSKTDLTIITNGEYIFPTLWETKGFDDIWDKNLTKILFEKFQKYSDLENYFKIDRKFQISIEDENTFKTFQKEIPIVIVLLLSIITIIVIIRKVKK